MKLIDLPQGSSEWLEWRRSKRMASESSVVTGRNPWQKPIQLARVKRGLETVQVNPAMQRGHDYEPVARSWYEATTRQIGDPIVLELGDYGCSLDWGNSGLTRICEIKVPFSANSGLWKMANDNVVPEYYLDQICHQLAVTGAERCDFVVHLPEEQAFRLIEVEPMPARWDEIRMAWDAFWNTYMVGDLHDDERTDTVWMSACEAYRAAKKQYDEAELMLLTAKNELISMAEEQSAKGFGINLIRVEKEGSISYASAIKKLGVEKEFLEQFRGKPTTSYMVKDY